MIRGTRSRTSSGTADTSAASAPSIVVAFDVLQSGHYTTDAGGIDLLRTQGPITGLDGTQANPAVRPDLSAAAISGKDAMSFVGANGDFMTIQNALSAFGGTYGIWAYFVGQFSTLADGQGLFATIFNSTGTGLFQPSVRGNKRLRASVRRVAADATKTIEGPTNILVLDGDIPTGGGVGFDSHRGRILFGSNQDYGYVSTGAFVNGYGKIESVASAAAPILGRQSSLFLNGLIGRLYLGVGVATPEFFETLRLINQPIFNTPQRTLAVDATTLTLRNKIYREGSGATIAKSGTVISGGDAEIMGRLLDMGTDTPATGWETPVSIGTSTGLVWSTVLNTDDIPNGSWFLEVRKSGERDVDAVVDRTSLIGVSNNITATVGQSLIRNQTTETGGGAAEYPPSEFEGSFPPATGDTLRDRRWSLAGYGYYYTSQTTIFSANVPEGTGEPSTAEPGQLNSGAGGPGGGNGVITLAKLLRDLHAGAPSLIIQEAIGGTVLAQHLAGGSVDLNIDAQLTDADGPGYDWTRAVMNLGQTDMNAGTSYSAFHGGLISYIDQIRGRTTDGNALYFYICPVSWVSAGNPTTAKAHPLYQATWNVIDAYDNYNIDGTGRVFLGYTDHDMQRRDGYHLAPANNPHTMRRLAQNIAYREHGAANGARGPKLASIAGTNGGTTIVGTFTLDGGTTLQGLIYNAADPYFHTPAYQTTGLTGTLARVNGAPVTPVSVEITGATEITWTLAAPLASGNTIDIGLYTDPAFDQSVMITDDTSPSGDSIGVPAQPTRLWVSGVVA